jgi:hypothetical protein
MQQEVIGLQALEEQMSLRVVALKRNRIAAEYAESFSGKIITWSWAVYCVCRVYSVSGPPLYSETHNHVHTSQPSILSLRLCQTRVPLPHHMGI